jgi:hypothetical protein
MGDTSSSGGVKESSLLWPMLTLWQSLGARKTVKEAWEAVKVMRLGADRIKEVNTQKLLREFENIAIKDGESIEDFGMRITNLIGNLRTLSETMEDVCVVKKFLHVVSAWFIQVVVSIEMFYDMKQLMVDKLVGRLRAVKERLDDKVDQIIDKAGWLLLTEDKWFKKHKHHFHSNCKVGGGGSGGGSSKGKAAAHQGRSN